MESLGRDLVPRRSNDSETDSNDPEQREPADPHSIITKAPTDRFKLGLLSVMSLVVNRMVGSGVFVSSTEVFTHMGSPGAAIVLWLGGLFYSVAATIVYIEYGRSIPRRRLGPGTQAQNCNVGDKVVDTDQRLSTSNGQEVSVPRSGGDLNYLQYVYSSTRFAYSDGTLQLVTFLFAMPFIVFGTMAPNAINFGMRVLMAVNLDVHERKYNALTRGIAFGVTLFACVIHTLSRKSGIILNNFFALIKMCILMLIIILAICYSGGVFPNHHYPTHPNRTEVVQQNLHHHTSFQSQGNPPLKHTSHFSEFSSYSIAFLDVIFATAGVEQANYVLGEISKPHRTFPWALGISATMISSLYVIVNICFFSVVPQDMIEKGTMNITDAFFILTLGSLSTNDEASQIRKGKRISSALLAVSALGNVIVMTYTATRVKQEIAKEGVFLPFSKFFASNVDLSIGRFLKWAQEKAVNKPSIEKYFSWILRSKWLTSEDFQEETPVGAMTLHVITSVILIFSTWSLGAYEAYHLLSNIAAYLINAFFGVLISAGILYLRFKPSTNWSRISPIHRVVSALGSIFFLLMNLFPLIARWFPPENLDPKKPKWFLVPLISVVALVFGLLYWGLLMLYTKVVRSSEILMIERTGEYEKYALDPEGPGYWVQLEETTKIEWLDRETVESENAQIELRTLVNDKI